MQWLLAHVRNVLITRLSPLLLIAITVAGCAPGGILNLPPGEGTLNKLQAGMSENVVILLAGKPDRIKRIDNSAKIIYYRNGILSNCAKDLSGCTPIAIESGRVAAIGAQWLNAWEKEREAERKRKTAPANPPVAAPTPSVNTAEPSALPATPDKPLVLTSRGDSRRAEAAKRAEIARLEAQVRHIPVARTLDNLKIYRYLLKLAPENRRYRKKVAFYEDRFEKEKAIRPEIQIEALERQRRQNLVLQKYKGNESVQMALKNLGSGMFHVWLKSTAKAPFHVMASDFTLECRNGEKFPVYQSRDFDVNLMPGNTIEGRITFDAYCDPLAIHFSNKAVGRIFRLFPEIDLSKKTIAPEKADPAKKETPKKAPKP